MDTLGLWVPSLMVMQCHNMCFPLHDPQCTGPRGPTQCGGHLFKSLNQLTLNHVRTGSDPASTKHRLGFQTTITEENKSFLNLKDMRACGCMRNTNTHTEEEEKRICKDTRRRHFSPLPRSKP